MPSFAGSPQDPRGLSQREIGLPAGGPHAGTMLANRPCLMSAGDPIGLTWSRLEITVDTEVLVIETGRRRGTFDITRDVAGFVAGRGDGLVSVFVPHATAGVAIFETGAGSDADFMDLVDRLIPRDDSLWRHRHGSPGHGADHVVPGIVAPSMTIPVVGGKLTLGTWQSVVLVDPNQDNATRRVRLSFLAG